MDGVIKERQIFNEVRDISELDECAHIDIDAFARQLRMARFAMHRVRISQYAGIAAGPGERGIPQGDGELRPDTRSCRVRTRPPCCL
jgi:hypothetical protein